MNSCNLILPLKEISLQSKEVILTFTKVGEVHFLLALHYELRRQKAFGVILKSTRGHTANNDGIKKFCDVI
jgi:hypothetical protein